LKKNLPKSFGLALALALCVSIAMSAETSLKEAMDGVVTRFYASLDQEELSSLTHEKVLALMTDEELETITERPEVPCRSAAECTSNFNEVELCLSKEQACLGGMERVGAGSPCLY